MQVIYEGKDITQSIEVHNANLIDNAGNIADGIELEFSDTKGLWSKWKPNKNDTVELKNSESSSGIMFVDQIEQSRGKFIIKALSIPQEAKTTRTRYWEKVRLFEVGKDIASKYGFTFKTFGAIDYQYERIGQLNQADLDFFSYRCILEGYVLKVYSKQLILYDERYLEQQKAVKNINLEDINGDFKFKSISTGLYKACTVTGYTAVGFVKSTFSPSGAPNGPELTKSFYLSNQPEAERFSKGLLRFENKKESQGVINIKLDSGIAAGNNINILGIGLADGKYFIERAAYDLKNEKLGLKLRKPLEGY